MADDAAELDRSLAALTASELAPLFLRPVRVGIESAWYGHVPFAQWLVAACRPRVLVELGSHNGVSYFSFCEAVRALGLDCRAYAVDTWEGDEHAGFYGDEVFRDVQDVNDSRYAAFSELLRCTFATAAGYFADGCVDLLHIDGLHTYDAVREDWETWRQKLSDRAVVLLHDVNVRERGFGVWQFWDGLRQEFPSFDFLHGHGLGLVAVGPEAPASVRALCRLDDAMKGVVRERFSLLGERWTERRARTANIVAQQRAEAKLAGETEQLRRSRLALEESTGKLADSERELHRLGEARQRERELLRRQLSTQARELSVLREERRAVPLGRAARAEAQRAADLAVLVAAHRRDQAELGALRVQLQAVATSDTWRATAPLRRVGARYPLAMRAAQFAAVVLGGRLGHRLRQRRRLRDEAALLQASGLFDPAFYRKRYPDVAATGTDPVWHYLWTGAAADYDPHPLFSTGWYRNTHPAVAEGGTNPLVHYLRSGAAQDLDPHPLFDTAHYRAQEPEAGADALLHYVETGSAHGRNPNPLFRTMAYREEYVRDAAEPLAHYVLEGAGKGCDPHELFDTDWYARTYPDSAGWNPLGHYLRQGRAIGHAPCAVLAEGEHVAVLEFAPVEAPDVTIIVPVYGHLFETLRCLHAIRRNSGEDVSYEVIVADDKPAAPTAPALKDITGLRVVANPKNLGFLRSCNHAATLARGRHLVFLNNDTTVQPGWLAPLVRLADADRRIGMAGVMLLNADGTVQEAGGSIGENGWGAPYGRGEDAGLPEYNFVREVDVVIGACFLVPRAVWQAVGGFDDHYAPAYYEEFDLAFALRARGFRVVYQPASRVIHYDASSYGAADRDRQSTINHELFCRKWAEQLAGQPRADAPPIVARQRPPAAGRILMIDDRVPEPDKHAGSMATFDYLRLMVEAGFAVTYMPHDREKPEPYTTVLEQMGIEVLHGDVDKADWLARNGASLDHVWSARPDVTAPLLDAIEVYAPGKLIYFTHDLHFLREERRHALDGSSWSLAESRRLRGVELDIFERARRVVTASSEERAVIRGLLPDVDVRTIPLYSVPSAPLAEVDPGRFAGRDTVVFVGGYAHPPNEDAAVWLARDIMPLVWAQVPAARLVLVGSKPTEAVRELADERVTVAGWLPDIAATYAASVVSVSPLRFGAGVKGKIISALQAGVPVVTTTIGNEGLGLADGRQALIGDSAAALADHIVALLRDPALCARLAAAGAEVLRTKFDEDAMRRTLLSVLGHTLCPVCGHRTRLAEAASVSCSACGASEVEQSLAEAAIRPFRPIGVASLRAAAPLLQGRARVPSGPLAAALVDPHPSGAAPDGPDLTITREGDGPPDAGRWVFAGDESHASRLDRGMWQVRLHEAGASVIEAERVEQAA